ncbi:MAG: TetR/AcrR family transcriptional regulator [Halieaceae bacterium]|nr:TetR/AcrR family transcriptional regulator [Halieaceae bacterium]
MTKTSETGVPDGRRQRSERSRQAIIDAMAAMIEEGNLIPTAQQASDRAGVGIRTVFRHFSDMGNLFSIADTQRRAYIEGLFAGGDRSGSLGERIQKLVDYRGEQFELVANIARSSLAQRWRYQALRHNYARYQRALKNDSFDWLPELTSLPAALQDSIEAQLSFEYWDRLRDHQGLNKDEAKAAVTETLARLLGP